MKAGVYIFKNSKTGDAYVGSSSQVGHAEAALKSLLKNTKSKGMNKKLQEAWNKSKPEDWKMEIAGTCTPREMPRLKQSIIEKIQPNLNTNAVRTLERGGFIAINKGKARSAQGEKAEGTTVLHIDVKSGGGLSFMIDTVRMAFDQDSDAEFSMEYAGKRVIWKAA